MRCVRWLAGIVGVAASFYVLGYAAIGMPTLGTAYWAARSQDRYCALRVPDGCDFLTQKFCGNSSTPPGNFHRKLARCMGSARKKSERVSCALVGSSSHLLTVAEGARIDAHDVVIRMNSAPDGSGRENGWLAPCVGNRTTVRFMNQFGLLPASAQPEPCRHLIKPWVNCLPLNCYVNFDECSRSCDTRRSVLCKPGNPQVRRPWKEMELLADTLHPSVAQRILSNGTGPPYRTTGFIAFTYAIGNCDHVTVYGFGAACDGRIGVRYYKGGFPIVLDHAYDRERKIIEDIARLGPSSGHLRRTPGWMRAATVDISRPPCLQSLSGRAWQLADDHCKQPG